ncbi:MAG: patatin-like phospholipase family protein [Christensenellales bacterium]
MSLLSFFKKKTKKVKKLKINPKIKLGLALGGGGARGFAHIGAIRAFEEHGIKFDYIAGTSVGSLVGCLYANGMTSDEMLKIAKTLVKKDIKTNKIMFVPSKTDGLENLVKRLLGDIDIKDLKKPFCAVAVDMKSGKEIDIRRGNLSRAIAGSCAVPSVFNYVDFEQFRLMDGGLLNNIPSDVAKSMGADFVVAVDCNPSRGYGTESTKLVDLLMAAYRITTKSNSLKGRMFADVLIEPNTKRFKSTRFDGSEDMVMEGYNAALRKINEIKILMSQKVKKVKKKNNNSNKILTEDNKI